jgi:hypothetical protein
MRFVVKFCSVLAVANFKNVTCYSALPIRVINKKKFIPHLVIVVLRCLQYFCSESK